MKEITDEQLLTELRNRFDLQRKLLDAERKLTAELEHMNKKLRASESLKSRFLSNIRNELVNPLTSLLGLSQNISNGNISDADKVREVAGIINAEMKNMNFQLTNIFYAAELEAGQTELRLSKMDLHTIIHEIIGDRTSQFELKKVTTRIYSTIEEREAALILDTEKTRMIIENLIDNALKFNKEGGEIEVHLGILEDNISILIKDTGVGIPDEKRDQIFDRFVQGEEGTTKNYPGHGLGLSIVSALVDMLSGTIEINSVEGEGTMAGVLLPLQNEDDRAIYRVEASNEELFNDVELF